MKKLLIKIFTLIVLFNLSYSIGNTKVIYAYVNGLVCDFCARSLEKNFEKEKSVKSITIDLQQKLLTIVLKKDKKLEDSKIIKLVNDAGYDVKEIKYEK